MDICIEVPIFVSPFASGHLLLGRPFEVKSRLITRNLDCSGCEVTIRSDNGSDEVTFLAYQPTEDRDRSHISGTCCFSPLNHVSIDHVSHSQVLSCPLSASTNSNGSADITQDVANS
jgi:hypothetical protein